MGEWIKHNWWLAIAGMLGTMLTALGVILPFEDRTVGATVGGVMGADSSVDLGEPIAVVTGSITAAIETIGLVVWVATMMDSRSRTKRYHTRPA